MLIICSTVYQQTWDGIDADNLYYCITAGVFERNTRILENLELS